MKLVFFALSLLSTISSFAAVHCDNNQGTELHSSREIIIGSEKFSDSDECKFSALVANKANTGITCAPYKDEDYTGFSIYRLEDGKDLGRTVYYNLNECNMVVSFSDEYAFCSHLDGEYYFWSIETNAPSYPEPFYSLEECMLNLYQY